VRAFTFKSGERFHRLVVVERLGSYPEGSSKWLFKCDCGKDVVARGVDVRREKQKSCGCHKDEQTTARNRANAIHGMHLSAEFRTWVDMLRRCHQPVYSGFSDWGGRGIKVCVRWHTFANFFADMGRRPSKFHSIDRINNDGDYEPGNCRWATKKEQSRNRRNSVFVFYAGREMPLGDACELAGLRWGTVWRRIKKLGWPVSEAFIPLQKRKQQLDLFGP